jgi:hypothetical protein
MAKSALSQKALRNAAPAETLPFQVVRKYGEPVLCGDLAGVRKRLIADLDDLAWVAKRIGTTEDRARIQNARQQVLAGVTDLPFSLDVLVDEHTGVRYQVEVTKRG